MSDYTVLKTFRNNNNNVVRVKEIESVVTVSNVNDIWNDCSHAIEGNNIV